MKPTQMYCSSWQIFMALFRNRLHALLRNPGLDEAPEPTAAEQWAGMTLWLPEFTLPSFLNYSLITEQKKKRINNWGEYGVTILDRIIHGSAVSQLGRLSTTSQRHVMMVMHCYFSSFCAKLVNFDFCFSLYSIMVLFVISPHLQVFSYELAEKKVAVSPGNDFLDVGLFGFTTLDTLLYFPIFLCIFNYFCVTQPRDFVIFTHGSQRYLPSTMSTFRSIPSPVLLIFPPSQKQPFNVTLFTTDHLAPSLPLYSLRITLSSLMVSCASPPSHSSIPFDSLNSFHFASSPGASS